MINLHVAKMITYVYNKMFFSKIFLEKYRSFLRISNRPAGVAQLIEHSNPNGAIRMARVQIRETGEPRKDRLGGKSGPD